MAQQQMKCGGTGDAMDATKEIQELCDQIRADLEGKVGKTFQKFKARSYKSQAVADTNYFVKIEVDGDFIHVRIYKPLPHTGEGPQLHSYQSGKSEQDSPDFF
jgi:cystatin-A/B